MANVAGSCYDCRMSEVGVDNIEISDKLYDKFEKNGDITTVVRNAVW